MGTTNKLKSLFSNKLILGTTIGSALIFMLAGVIFWGGFNTAMEATNTLGFCISCHEMEENVYQEYTKTIHYTNRSGVRATCSDCHVPDPWVYKFVRKIKASNELLHKALGSINTPEKFNAKRLKLAKNVWHDMKDTNSRECRNCHDFNTMTPETQKPRARKQHMNAMQAGNTCIDCHKGIAHKAVHDQLTDEELDKLTAPKPDRAIPLPPQWVKFLEEQAAAKESNEQPAATNFAEDVAIAQATSVIADNAGTAPVSTSSLDWSPAPVRNVTVFYPGEASMEWVLGRRHGGSRPFKKGDRCVDCHDEETADIGQKIVSGEKLESQVIPGKRGSIPVAVQAMHDKENLYLRFQWADTEHTPVPFVAGGKMDSKNAMKLAVMLATDDVEYADRAGCWGTCHADLNSMPYAPQGQDVTKYLTESRTDIEVRGRNDKPLGGWDQRKTEDEIKAEFSAGHYMDIIRYKAGEDKVEDGAVLADRVMQENSIGEFNAINQNGQWVVEIKRPLKSDRPDDISLALDQVYNFGFAIHDDYSNARYHHVSLGYKLAFDNIEVEVNAVER